MILEKISISSYIQTVKWVTSLILPAAVYFILPVDGKILTHHMAMFLVLTSWAVLIWSMDLINDIVVGMLLPILYIVLCAVPAKVVTGPWASQVPNTVIGGFILCKILQDTGLGRRIGLGCIKLMGGSFQGALWGLMLAIFIVNPLVPAVTGKGIIFCAIVVSLCESLDLKKQSREATVLMLVAFLSVASSKMCFLTGGGDLIIGMELVDKVLGTETGWLEYAKWNFIPATIYTIICVLTVIIMLPSKLTKEELRGVLESRYAELGPVKKIEKVASVLMIITFILLCTDKIHGLGAGMVLILVCFFAFLPKVELINGNQLKQINFAPLFFIMGCMAIGSAGNFLKVTDWLAANTLHYFDNLSLVWAGLSAYMVGVLGNFLLTPLAATVSLTSPIVELGVQMGIEPRILYFCFKYGFDNYLFPYEYAVLLLFYSFGYMHFGSMIKVLAVRMFITIPFLLLIAIPFWKWIL